MKILVTGSNGQLGRALQTLSTEYPDFTFLFTDVQELDITNGDKVTEFIHSNIPDVIVNCAAFTAVDKAEEEFSLARLINATSVGHLALAARDIKALFIQISTDFVFAGERNYPYKEDDDPKPLSIYGKTKYEGELQARSSALNSMIIRTSWLYSEHMHNFVKTVLMKGQDYKHLKVVYDQIGTPTYARDLAGAILQVIVKGAHFPIPVIYHYSNEGVASWYDFAQSVVEYSGIDCVIEPVRTKEYPLPAVRPKYSVLDKAKIKRDFGLSIPDWRQSLKECIKKMDINL